MKKKHRFLFFLWKIKMFLKGVKKGRFVSQYNSETKEDVKGVILYLYGVRVDNIKYDYGFKVQLFKSMEGTDYRYFSKGFYNYSDIISGKLKLLK